MDRYSKAFDNIEASDRLKTRLMEDMQRHNEREPGQRTIPFRSLPKRTLMVLIAAVILLMAGTALAVGLSAMGAARNRSAQAVASYQAVLEGQGDITGELPGPSPYITYTQFQTDREGQWLPAELPDVNLTAQVGELTVRFENLEYNREYQRLAGYLWVEAQNPVPYGLADLRLSLNGGEPIKTLSELQFEQEGGGSRPTPQPVANWDFDTMDENWLTFPLEENPFRVGNTLTLTGKLNGEAFALSYTLDEATYEALRQTQLQEVTAMAAVIDAIPDETIPVNVAARWSLIEDMAIIDHFLYYTEAQDPSVTITGGPRPDAPYDTYDDGMWTVVDGMITEHMFISSSDDENGAYHRIYRSYFPYDETNLPDESLISLVGVVFRIEWATGKVTGPKDEAEYNAWRKQSMELSSPDYGTDYIAKVNAQADTFTVTEAVYLNNWMGYFALVIEPKTPVDQPLHGMDRQPVVTLNGLRLPNQTNYIQTPNDFMGGFDQKNNRIGFWLDAPALRLLPDTFDVTVSFNGSETTFTLRKSDFTPGDAQSGEYKTLFGF